MDMRRRTFAEERTFPPKDETVSPPRPHRQQTSPMRPFSSYKDEAAASWDRPILWEQMRPHGEEAKGRLEPWATAFHFYRTDFSGESFLLLRPVARSLGRGFVVVS
jgi:hypothetical protein